MKRTDYSELSLEYAQLYRALIKYQLIVYRTEAVSEVSQNQKRVNIATFSE